MRVPIATYRLQLHRGFPFAAARERLGYLQALGISDLYASPVFTARSGSTHGYDVVDPTTINVELGGEEGLAALSTELRARGMGLLLDIVPNHMCVAGGENRWWNDVLENGPSSPFASFFDIDWTPPKRELENKVLLPFLGDQYGRVLEDQEIAVVYVEGGFFACLYGTRLPLAPRSWPIILRPLIEWMRAHLPDSDPHLMEMESILTSLERLPTRTETNPDRVKERLREKEVIRRRLRRLVQECPPLDGLLAEELARLNGRRGDPRSFDRLEALLAEQGYRLCHWKVAADEINFRRFFDVNELAAIRIEDPAVFAAVHGKVRALVESGTATGVRVDHVDGMYDPAGYLQSLAETLRAAAGHAEDPFYTVVEKVLSPGESLPPLWPVQGTTGYDFLNLVNGLFVHPEGAERLRAEYARFIGYSQWFQDVLLTSKKFILLVSLSSELYVLANRLDRISEQHRASRDFTLESLRFALREVFASFAVYRTYVRGTEGTLSVDDRAQVERAIEEAKRRNPATPESLFDFLRQVLLLERPDGIDDAQMRERVDFVLRAQQLTGPITAKGMEDTAFYRYFPLASANEVGGDPDAPSTSLDEFHAANAARLRSSPHALLATSTHDTKRGEDLRARLDALSEVPDAWATALARWAEMNRGVKASVEGREVPDRNDEYFLYQTLVGAWPFDGPPEGAAEVLPRLREYLRKALREAKVHSSWIRPNEGYERGVEAFLERILAVREGNPFPMDLRAFLDPVRLAGVWNSLVQVVLKVASPGVPDFFQGTELWNLTLVDPDNRRPVDFAAIEALAASVDAAVREDRARAIEEMVSRPGDGRIKLHVTREALRLRGRRRALFETGDYVPLAASGARGEHVVAFARATADDAVIAATGRWFLRLAPAGQHLRGREPWGDLAIDLPPELARGRFRDAFSGRVIAPTARGDASVLMVADLFETLPVALLEREP